MSDKTKRTLHVEYHVTIRVPEGGPDHHGNWLPERVYNAKVPTAHGIKDLVEELLVHYLGSEDACQIDVTVEETERV